MLLFTETLIVIDWMQFALSDTLNKLARLNQGEREKGGGKMGSRTEGDSYTIMNQCFASYHYSIYFSHENNMIKLFPRASHKLPDFPSHFLFFFFSRVFVSRATLSVCDARGKKQNINGQREENLGKMLTFSVLHVALKNWFQTFRQWRC